MLVAQVRSGKVVGRWWASSAGNAPLCLLMCRIPCQSSTQLHWSRQTAQQQQLRCCCRRLGKLHRRRRLRRRSRWQRSAAQTAARRSWLLWSLLHQTPLSMLLCSSCFLQCYCNWQKWLAWGFGESGPQHACHEVTGHSQGSPVPCLPTVRSLVTHTALWLARQRSPSPLPAWAVSQPQLCLPFLGRG